MKVPSVIIVVVAVDFCQTWAASTGAKEPSSSICENLLGREVDGINNGGGSGTEAGDIDPFFAALQHGCSQANRDRSCDDEFGFGCMDPSCAFLGVKWAV